MSVNRVFITGNLGSDPAVNYLPNGTAKCEVRVATNQPAYTNKAGAKVTPPPEWHNIVLFGAPAENLAKFGAKGRLVHFEGRIQYDTWEYEGKKYYKTVLVMHTFQFMDSPKAATNGQANVPPVPEAAPGDVPFQNTGTDMPY